LKNDIRPSTRRWWEKAGGDDYVGRHLIRERKPESSLIEETISLMSWKGEEGRIISTLIQYRLPSQKNLRDAEKGLLSIPAE